ncbi:MAG: hypothetical protein XD69_0089 [Clostridia bacterium 62_21]|nr:MAG: hypothetical protein XD69_0089 [Clostridia bacterium 62_21]HAG07485.1 hypothetical protein [Peptococcaceae bacterium]
MQLHGATSELRSLKADAEKILSAWPVFDPYLKRLEETDEPMAAGLDLLDQGDVRGFLPEVALCLEENDWRQKTGW